MKINRVFKATVSLVIVAIISLSGVTASAKKFKGTTFEFNYAKRNNSYDISIESNKKNGVAGLDYSILYDTLMMKAPLERCLVLFSMLTFRVKDYLLRAEAN